LALLDIDSCPIEGFQPDKYDEILNLQQKNLQAKVVLAIGDKSSQDTYQHVAKVRFSKDELFEEY
jgi:nitroreductase